MPYGRRSYKRTSFAGTRGRSTLAKARQKNARFAKASMSRKRATAKVAASALRLARANRLATFGPKQKTLFGTTAIQRISAGKPACFMVTGLHAGLPGAVNNGLPVYTLGAADFVVDEDTNFWSMTSGVNVGIHDAASQGKWDQWRDNHHEPNHIFKWGYQSYVFVLDCDKCRNMKVTYHIDFYRPRMTRFERPSTKNDMSLPDQLTTFGNTLRGPNTVNSEHWVKMRKTTVLTYAPGNSGNHTLGRAAVSKAVYLKMPGNQKKGIRIDPPNDQQTMENEDRSFVRKTEFMQIPMRDQIWCVITSDMPDDVKDAAGTSIPQVNRPIFGARCLAGWRDLDTIGN